MTDEVREPAAGGGAAGQPESAVGGDGALVANHWPMRLRSSPDLLRAQCRVLLFATLAVCTLAAGDRLPFAVAAAGLATAALSLRVAAVRGAALSVSFVAIDWLVLGLLLAAAGGVRGGLLAAVPLLAFIELAPASAHDRMPLLAPAAAMILVLLIVDPSLGGQRALHLAHLAGLVAAGAVPALLLGRLRRAARQRTVHQQRPPSVDDTTGFSTLTRLADLLGQSLREAAAGHEALSVVCLRLDHFEDTRAFLGEERAEAIVAGVARRVQRRLRPGDLAFRVTRDTFVLCLRGRLPRETRNDVAALQHDVAAHLVERHRQTVSVGIAAFPAARTVEELLRGAHQDLQPTAAQPVAAAQ